MGKILIRRAYQNKKNGQLLVTLPKKVLGKGNNKPRYFKVQEVKFRKNG